jgi:orotidine-5'-phosphate decarboxylase
MKGKILVALDTVDMDRAIAWARPLVGLVGGVKLGLEFFLANGHAGYRTLAKLGLPVFLDLKFHDIPNTVAGAMRAVAELDPFIINVHAGGGKAMMQAAAQAAREEAAKRGSTPPKIIAVTVLTSLDEGDLATLGQMGPVADQVRRLAALTKEAGLDGIVCSPAEITTLRRQLGPDFLLVTPGVRPEWAGAGDQKRVMSPGEAIKAGADFLVIGRPITASANPAEAARRIEAEIDAAQKV